MSLIEKIPVTERVQLLNELIEDVKTNNGAEYENLKKKINNEEKSQEVKDIERLAGMF